MLRIILISFVALCLLTVAVMGVRGMTSGRPPLQWWDDMVLQPKYKPQQQSAFFADGRVERPQPVGTVAWGRDAKISDPQFEVSDEQLFKLDKVPLRVDRDLLNRGREMFATYCAVCHDGTGAGAGVTTQYGMINPPSYHQARLREVTDGYLYQTITNGKGQMGPLGDRVKRNDRWAIVAYVRALQRANNATIDDVPESKRAELK